MGVLPRTISSNRMGLAWLAWLPVLVLLAAGGALMLTVSPLVRIVPGRDSGVFLYVASVILDGGLPYRDVWDHKPPGIYYLNVLGLILGGHSLWGIWIIQTLFVATAIVLGFALMKKALGIVPSLFGSVAWISTLGLLLIWDNYPEEYALPLQFASLYFYYQAERSQQSSRGRALAMASIGILAAACFLLKPTLIGTQLAIALLLVYRSHFAKRRPARILHDLGAVCLGILLVLAPVTAYFSAQGALGEAVDAIFRYGVLYSAAPVVDRLLSVISGLGGLPALSGAPALALIAWARICRHTVQRCGRLLTPDLLPPINANMSNISSTCQSRDGPEILSTLALITLPIEFLLVAISGRSYGYYYTAWLPIIGVLCALFAYELIGACTDRVARAGVGCLCALLPVMIGVPAAAVVNRLNTPMWTAMTRAEAIHYIAANTSATDSVLIWGAEPGVNFAAERRSPTRFVYQYPLYTRGYADASIVKRFLREIDADPPSLIIDASSSDRITLPIHNSAQQQWVPVLVYDLPLVMGEVLEYIGSHYEFVGSLGPDRWQVYAGKWGRLYTGGE